MRWSGRTRTALAAATGVVAGMIALAAVVAGPAGADNDLGQYQGEKKNVSVTSARSYDEATKQTTFTFTLSATENVSHVVLMACEGIQIVSATGPNGANKEGDAPKNDPSIDDQGQHVGIKFEPGVPGTYTIVLAGNIAAADFVVKAGDGHKHFASGTEVCKPVSTPETPPGPSGEQPPGGNTSTNPGAEGASNQNSGTGTEVGGATAAKPGKPGTNVLGEQLTAPETQGATLPRTGLPLQALAPIGTMLVALGGLATALGRWSRG